MTSVKHSQKDLSVIELATSKQISFRTARQCHNNGMIFLSDILNFHSKGHKFDRLKACGTKTANELLNVCSVYQGVELSFNNDKIEEDVKDTISLLPEGMMDMLEAYCEFLFCKISRRSYNALLRAIGNDEKKVILFMLDKSTRFLSLRNIGVVSARELEQVRVELIRYINIQLK